MWHIYTLYNLNGDDVWSQRVVKLDFSTTENWISTFYLKCITFCFVTFYFQQLVYLCYYCLYYSFSVTCNTEIHKIYERLQSIKIVFHYRQLIFVWWWLYEITLFVFTFMTNFCLCNRNLYFRRYPYCLHRLFLLFLSS